MDSVLDWKNSPPLYEVDNEDTLYQSFLNEDIKFEVDDSELSKAEIASNILGNLENLMNLDDLIKDDFLDDKMLPILDDMEPPTTKIEPPDTQSLLKEFENVYDGFNNGTLTPPQSPPFDPTTYYQNTKYLNGGDFVPYNVQKTPIVPENPIILNQGIVDNHPFNIITENPSVDDGLTIVDNIVFDTVEDMQWINSPTSPDSSINSSFEDSSSSSEDPEWVPEYIQKEPASPVKTKKSKPHSKNPDRKIRKKEQNKEAATRYRLKKKAEAKVIFGEEKDLLDKKTSLNAKVTDLQTEIKYIKGLMRDFYKAKGLIA